MTKEPKQAFLKPAPGCMIRDDQTRQFLKEEGEWKPLTIYWMRRIRMVDVIECEPIKKNEHANLRIMSEPLDKNSSSRKSEKGKSK